MIRLAALLLTVLTGFTGLVYEVAWQKYLAALLGSHGEATAAVLAIFLGGLSAGYALFGRATRRLVERARREGRPPRLLTFYALVEAGIGGYALLFPILFSGAQFVSLLGPVDQDALGFAFDVVLSALLIGPPAVLMGGTIPVLTLALAGDLKHATRVHAWIYGCNTLGAFAGALAGAFVLVPVLGLDGVVRTMGAINLAAALVFVGLDRGASRVAPDLAEPASAEPVANFAVWAAIALLAGFGMMALQTTLNRIGALSLGSSHFTFAMVVAVFVLCIALGSLAVSVLPRIPRSLVVGSQWALVYLMFPLYVALASAPYWAHLARVRAGASDAAFFEYQAAIFFMALAALAIPVGLSGALLPLLFDQLRRQVRDLGAVAGRLYAWNTVGSLLGALLGGYMLLFWLDLHHVYRIAMACLAVGASLLTLLVLGRRRRLVTGLVLLPTLAVISLLPQWPPERLSSGVFRDRTATPATFLGPGPFFERRIRAEILFYTDDPVSTVSVGRPRARPKNLSLRVNGKPDGAIEGDYPTMALLGLIPAHFAERHERCFVVGLGTGVTAGELASLEETREVTVAEISRGVIAAVRFFDGGNLGASRNPKVEIVRGDAYRSLLRSRGDYDVIVSEPSNPWVAGVEMLYSREFLEAARSRLAPGGVYAQWLHLYETDAQIVELVLRTYVSVFPHVSVWFTGTGDLLLLGFDRPERALDVRALAERFGQPDFAAGYARVGIESLPQLLAHELIPLGTLHVEALDGPIQTLRRPILSDWAARAFFRGGELVRLARYSSERQRQVSERNSVLRRYAGGAGSIPEEGLEAAAREACRMNRRADCATFLARWSFEHPDSPRQQATRIELRKSMRPRSGHLAERRLQILLGFYAGEDSGENGARTSEELRNLTRRFLYHYHQAVPFDPGVLAAAWDRCEGEGCAEGRRWAEDQVRGLDGS